MEYNQKCLTSVRSERGESIIKLLPHPFLDRLRRGWASRSPFLLFALKSALTAGISWEVAFLLLGTQAAALAVMSALVSVQVTNWQTVRKGIELILGVIIGVSLAVLVAHLAGINFLTITLMIFCAQIIGMFLQKRGQYLANQIPISAALVLLLGAGRENYPLLRILGAVIGALVGSIVSLLLSLPVYVLRTRDALTELMTRLADAMAELARALADSSSDAERREVYSHMQALEQQVKTTQQALALALDSARLNPWAHSMRHMLIDYPETLQTLERLARQMRRIAYTLNEPESSWSELVQQQEWAANYAYLLEEMGKILSSATHALHETTPSASSDLPDREALHDRIEQAQQELQTWQAQLAQEVKQRGASQTLNEEIPFVATGVRIAVRGAILVDLRRMLDEVHDVIEMCGIPALREHM